jgi:acylphosphatase
VVLANMNRVHLVIQGRVQGVGFRYFVLRRAQALGLTGWVQNRADGAVEVEAEGARDSLEKLESLVREGPAHADVASVAVEWLEGEPRHPRFWIR